MNYKNPRNFKIFMSLLVAFATQSLQAQVCMNDWETKVPITINNSAGDELTDYQVLITIDTETPILLGMMEPDGSDIRITMNNCCEPLCYYIESGINTATTEIWVNVPLIEAGTTTEIYGFFGNPGVEAVSDPECTFAFYEGFDDADLNLEYLCGEISDSTVTDGDFNLAWSNNGMMGSYETFPFDQVYTAEVMMNETSGSWPAVYWAKSVSEKNYGLMTDESEARISLSGGGLGWCTGHNWASALIPYSDEAGLWSFTWIETGNLIGDIPTAGVITTADALYAKDEDLRLAIGGISSGAGSMNMDWIRVRKYAAVPPTFEIGEPVVFAPGPDLSLMDEITECSSATIDGGEGYVSYIWSSGGTDQLEEVLLSGTYYLTAIDAEECVQIDSTAVTIAPEYDLVNSETVCIGDSYTFPDGTTMDFITDEIVHTSELTTEGFGCDSIIVTTIDVYGYSPLLDLGEDILSCGDSVFVDAGAGFGSYEWNDGGTEQIDTALITGTYSVTVVDDNGCEQSDEIEIEVLYIDNATSLSGYTITSAQEGATYQWIDCDADFAEIEGETGMSFEATANGNYAVVVTIGECVDTSECSEIAGLSIKENTEEANLFSIYPNPSNGQFNVVLNDLKGDIIINITSVDGKLIESKTTIGNQTVPFTVTGASGIYFVEVFNNQFNQIIKVIIE